MRTFGSYSRSLVFVSLFLSLIIQPKVHPQSIDSVSSHRSTAGALQFQLIGGLGVYYIGECCPSSSFRIGADASFTHNNSSGTNESNSSYSGGTPSSSSSSGHPDETYTSYEISVSGLCIHKLAEYVHTSLYCGAGPMASYSHYKHSNESASTYSSTYDTSNNNGVYEDRSTTWGVGPLGIIGIKSQLLESVSLSAEMSISALYQWTSQSSSSTSQSTDTSQNTYTSSSVSTSDLKGWSVSLSSIRIGIIIAL